ncbi:MAG TPA: signal peptidase II [Luteimonas sp.]|nr:signal peptidase II [Luteimonas sp.]
MMTRPSPNALPWLGLSALMIVLDQWTKWLAVGHLEFQMPVPVIDGFWNWNLTHNTGAAFSFLAQAGGWQHAFFVGLAVLISLTLSIWLSRTARSEWRTALPFALIIAGALGNVVDRLRLGYVVDFIEWYYRGFHWPVFNVADSCIVVGATLMVLFNFASKEKHA